MIPAQDREAHAAFKRMNLNDADKPIAILPALDINYSYFGFTKKKNLSAFKKEFDRMLTQMRTSGEIARMLEENYGISGYK
jgi:ABC-type amino acid transport substrate-binding protein